MIAIIDRYRFFCSLIFILVFIHKKRHFCKYHWVRVLLRRLWVEIEDRIISLFRLAEWRGFQIMPTHPNPDPLALRLPVWSPSAGRGKPLLYNNSAWNKATWLLCNFAHEIKPLGCSLFILVLELVDLTRIVLRLRCHSNSFIVCSVLLVAGRTYHRSNSPKARLQPRWLLGSAHAAPFLIEH